MLPARLLAGLWLLALLGACATAPQSAALLRQAPATVPASFEITNVPFFPQDDYQCGPAALATVLQAGGLAVTPAQLVPLVYVPARRGSFQTEMSAAARRHGRLVYTLEPTLDTLLREVAAGHPVLVLQNLGLERLPRWHYAVVKGYDLQRERLLLNSGRTENHEVGLATFERTWARAGHWAQVVLPPSGMPLSAQPQAYFDAVVSLEESGQAAAALQALDTGLRRWPQERSLLVGAGNLQYAAGDRAGALQRFTEAVRLYPDFAPARNNLAQLLYESGRRDEALVHARRAVELGGEFSTLYRATLRMIEES